MTVREFFNNDFTVDGDVVIKHFNQKDNTYDINQKDNTYDILGFRFYELSEKEKDYEITYIYANQEHGLNIEVKYPNED